MSDSARPTAVLFVCLGNICRSPLAKAVFAHQAAARLGPALPTRLRIDSCGTGHWHVGGPADPRTIAVASRHAIPLDHVARQLDPATDFPLPGGFDWLIAMDRDNRDNLLHAGAPPHAVRLMRSFDPALAGEPEHRLDVPDPYLGGPEGFDRVLAMLQTSCAGLLAHILSHPLPASHTNAHPRTTTRP
ncbi:MAG: low molecular weight phosphotyrosine protein phosphatase [Phycisphaerae bacterium]|nr:low molecular weight phosphotyrosine protein phosphatase [Phycisphaerae bacterium]